MSRSARFAVSIAAIFALTCFADVASPFSGGITRKSGKQGGTCNGCHQGGVTPKVTLDGPTSLDAGMLATYTFRIETAAAITGMNAAVSADDAVMAGDGDGGTREDENEVTHARTIRPDGGAAVYTFSMVAPPYGGKITLYAAGNACDGNGNTEGDESAATSIEIDVIGPPRPPPPPPPQEPPSERPAETPSSSGYGGEAQSAPPEDDSGCAVGWAGPRAPATSVAAALVAVAAVARRVRSRRR
jgi:hypothetical protein